MSLKDYILSHSGQFNHYKEETKKLKKENKKLKKEIKNLKEENKKIKDDLKNSDQYEDGISIIIPTYKGENHIKPLLESLEKQTLDPEKYELIFIINGEMDSTINILKEFTEQNTDKNVIITYTSTPGVSNARNIGLRIAKKEYTGFIDDDDFVSPKYLEKLYEHSKPNRVVMTNFIDIDDETKEEMESFLVPFSEKAHGVIKEAPVKFLNLAVITQAKSIPTFATKSVQFNTNLNNGVDVSYYARLYPNYDFEFYFIDKAEEAIYYRLQREGSISRPKMSFKFNVIERLKVIGDLDPSFKATKSKKYKRYLTICAEGQTRFMNRYLDQHPEDEEKVLEEIKKHDYEIFPYYVLDERKKD